MRLVLLLAATGLLAAPPVMAAHPTPVLVLYSNGRLLPANIELERGLREGLTGLPERNVELFAEFLDQPAFSGDAYERTVATYLRDKYLGRPPATIVATGTPALRFVLRHRAELFPGVPVVHLAADKGFVTSVLPLPANIVGVPVAFDFAGTIELAMRLHPDLRHLVVVTGASDWDREWEAILRAGLAQMRIPAPVEYLSAETSDAVQRRLGELGPGDVVFTPGYFRDGAAHEFLPRASVALMADASRAPIYGPYSTFIGAGVVGGSVPSYVAMGHEAAKSVGALLDGVAPEKLGIAASIPAEVQLDWRQVKRWNIAEDRVPRDALIRFREPTFWEANRGKVLIAVAVMLLQALLIAALLVERRLRRRTATALEESEARMNLAARAARISVWAWDVARDRLWPSIQSRAADGREPQPPTAYNQVLATVHSADRERFDQAVQQAVGRDEELDVEYRVLGPGGEVRWLAVRGRTTKDNGDFLTGVALDITARKAAELQATTDRAALTHMSRVSMVGQLSAAIAHQLNQPLSAIMGNAEVVRGLLDRGSTDLAAQREICDDIVTEANRAAEVIRRLSALYRRGELVLAPLDLNELVLETLDLVRAELTNRRVVPTVDLRPSLPMIEGDRVQLQQVLMNLILNAADAMSGIDASQHPLGIHTTSTGDAVELSVVDHGTGIAPADLGNVFQAFWSTKAKGFGLGLAICRSIVEAHNGRLTVANNEHGGATFSLVCPVRQLA